MTSLILDLRGNSGGIMEAAIQIANQFLKEGQLIVYTKGRASPRTEARATGKGEFETGDLVVLIDEWSASASEILAGAFRIMTGEQLSDDARSVKDWYRNLSHFPMDQG